MFSRMEPCLLQFTVHLKSKWHWQIRLEQALVVCRVVAVASWKLTFSKAFFSLSALILHANTFQLLLYLTPQVAYQTANNVWHTEEEILAAIWISFGHTRSLQTLATAPRGRTLSEIKIADGFLDGAEQGRARDYRGAGAQSQKRSVRAGLNSTICRLI